MGAKGLVGSANTEENSSDYKFEKQREKDSKLVKGKFINREVPGGELTFHYRGHKGEPIKTYTLMDGNEYELPIGVVKNLLNGCQVEETTNEVILVDPNTYRPLYAKKMKPRFSFVTSEFFE